MTLRILRQVSDPADELQWLVKFLLQLCHWLSYRVCVLHSSAMHNNGTDDNMCA